MKKLSSLSGVLFFSPALSQADEIRGAERLLSDVFGQFGEYATGAIGLNEITDGGLLGSMFSVFNLTALTAVSLFSIVSLLMVFFNAGISGKIASNRYNSWSMIRTAVAFLLLIPLVGGLSGAQFVVLQTASAGSTLGDQVNDAANRYLFANNRFDAPSIDTHRTRQLVETVYLNELCRIASRYEIEDYLWASERNVEKYNYALDNGLLTKEYGQSVRGKLLELIAPFRRGSFEVKRVYQETLDEPWRMGGVVDLDGNHVFNINWGSERTRPDSCGAIRYNLNVGRYDRNERERIFATNYFSAQVEALKELTEHASSTIENAVYSIREREKELRRSGHIPESFQVLESVDYGHPLLYLLYRKQYPDYVALDKFFYEETVRYKRTVEAALKRESIRAGQAFDEMLSRASDLMAQERLGVISKDDLDDSMSELHFLADNSRRGWMYAGFKYQYMSRNQKLMRELQSEMPTPIPFSSRSHLQPTFIQERLVRLHGFSHNFHQAKSAEWVISANDGEIDHEYIYALSSEYNDSVGGFVNKFSESLGAWITQGLGAITLSTENRDVLSALQNTGHNMLNMANVMFITSIGVDVAGGRFKALNKVASGAGFKEEGKNRRSDLISLATGMLRTVSYVLWFIGGALAAYIPLAVVFHWLLGVVNWLQRIILMLIASVTWAASFAIPDGETVIGRFTMKGFGSLAMIFLYPAAMVIGLHLAVGTLWGLSPIIDYLISNGVKNVQSGYVIGLFTGIVSFLLIVGFVLVVVTKIMGWTQEIPELLESYLDAPSGGGGRSETTTVAAAASLPGAGAASRASMAARMAGRNPNNQPLAPTGGPRGGGQGSKRGF